MRACVRRTYGLLLGGKRGAEIIRDADHALRRLGVVNPERYAYMYTPGLS